MLSLDFTFQVTFFNGWDGAQGAGGCDGAQGVAERSYPTSEVKGRSLEDPIPEGRQRRGVTPYQRSGAASQSARRRRRSKGREELPRVRGRGRGPGGATPRQRPGAAAGRSYPVRGQGRRPGGATQSEARGGVWEGQPHIQGALAARAPEGQRSSSTFKVGRGGGAEIPVVQVRSSGCALLEEP